MEKLPEFEQLLEKYYSTLAEGNDWQSTITENFRFRGPVNISAIGKDAYVETINRFRKVFKRVNPKLIIINSTTACVIASYDLISPAGTTFSADIAEVWDTEDEKLSALTIYYDTVTFNNHMGK